MSEDISGDDSSSDDDGVKAPAPNSYASALANANTGAADKTKQVGTAPNPNVQIKPHMPYQERFLNVVNTQSSLSQLSYLVAYEKAE